MNASERQDIVERLRNLADRAKRADDFEQEANTLALLLDVYQHAPIPDGEEWKHGAKSS